MFESIKNKVLDISDLASKRSELKDKKIVFCSGCYDILQSGHAVFFNQCKALGDVLVVGVGRDSVISSLKGPSRPINPEINRLYLVAAMQDVDFALLNEKEIKEGKIDFANILKELRPDIFVLNDDDSGKDAKIKLCDTYNIKIMFVPREVPQELEATSSSKIIEKINFSWKAPLRIDFAGGWTDVPFIMKEQEGFVCNAAINPLIEYKNGQFNFSGYPRGSGLSTSTAAKLLEMLSAKNYSTENKSLECIAEDLFNLENTELNWAIGRQDQYSIVYGGFNFFRFSSEGAIRTEPENSRNILEKFRKGLLLLHTGASRNAQKAVEEVYTNFTESKGKKALEDLAVCAQEFYDNFCAENFIACAKTMSKNFEAQKILAPSSSNSYLDSIYTFALENGAYGGKICGAGGGGAFVFYCEDPKKLQLLLKEKFVETFEIDFSFEYKSIKQLNQL